MGDTGTRLRTGTVSLWEGPLFTVGELGCHSCLNQSEQWVEKECPCSAAPRTTSPQPSCFSLPTDQNMASPADMTTLRLQPVEPVTEIQGDFKFPIPHEPMPKWVPTKLTQCLRHSGCLTKFCLLLFCKYASILPPLIRTVNNLRAEMTSFQG